MSKIMIVDDAAFMRSVIKGILEAGGYTDTCEAGDGDTALYMFTKEKPDLTILDITMPNQSGIETLKKMLALDPQAKAIMCSAIGQEKQIVEAIQAGAIDYIVKPFKPEQMIRSINKILG